MYTLLSTVVSYQSFIVYSFFFLKEKEEKDSGLSPTMMGIIGACCGLVFLALAGKCLFQSFRLLGRFAQSGL